MDHTGDFQVMDRGMLEAQQVVAMVRVLPRPVTCDYEPKVCPPSVGFSDEAPCGNVARTEDGKFWILQGGSASSEGLRSREATLSEVEQWVRAKYTEG